MSKKIITAAERMQQSTNIRGAIMGEPGIGKTTLVTTLNPEDTLFVRIERGVIPFDPKEWAGDIIELDNWKEARGVACLFAGADPLQKADEPYSVEKHAAYKEYFSDLDISKYKTIFIDSVTHAASWSFEWCQRQPEAFNKTGEPDTRSAYGLLGRELETWFNKWQFVEGKDIWYVGHIKGKANDLNEIIYDIEMKGAGGPAHFERMLDEMLLMRLQDDNGEVKRVLYTGQPNPYKMTAKDRTGKLAPVESADLGAIINKINS